jgi:hypothetical protein
VNHDDLEVAKTVTEGTVAGLLQSFHHVILNVAGPGTTEIGLEIADSVQEWRLRRAVRIGRRAITIADNSRAPRRRVSLKFLEPALQQASLEEEPTLQERWSALLATAMNATATEITLAYVDILRELTAADARLLQWVRDRVPDVDPNEPIVPDVNTATRSQSSPRAAKSAIIAEYPMSDTEFELMASRLERLGLCDVGRFVFQTRAATSGTGPRRYDAIALRPLGVAFVDACRSPEGSNEHA